MARSILVTTLGFDTKFQLKTLARIGAGNLNLVVIVRPSTGDEKADKAERELIDFCRDILGLKSVVLRVDVLNPPEAIGEIVKALRRLNPSLIMADLSGGMRLLIMETLAALLSLRRYEFNLRIHVWTEDLTGKVELDPRLFSLPTINDVDFKILELLAREGSLSLKEMTSKLSIPRSTVHARLRRLVDDGLISRGKDKGIIVYSITQLGLTVYHAESGGMGL